MSSKYFALVMIFNIILFTGISLSSSTPLDNILSCFYYEYNVDKVDKDAICPLKEISIEENLAFHNYFGNKNITDQLPPKFNTLPKAEDTQYDYSFFQPISIKLSDEVCKDNTCNRRGECKVSQRGYTTCKCEANYKGRFCDFSSTDYKHSNAEIKRQVDDIMLKGANKQIIDDIKILSDLVRGLYVISDDDYVLSTIFSPVISKISEECTLETQFTYKLLDLINEAFTMYYFIPVSDLTESTLNSLRASISKITSRLVNEGKNDITVKNNFYSLFIKSFSSSTLTNDITQYVKNTIKQSGVAYVSYFDATEFTNTIEKTMNNSTVTMSYIAFTQELSDLMVPIDNDMKDGSQVDEAFELLQTDIIDLKFYNDKKEIIPNDSPHVKIIFYFALNPNYNNLNAYLTRNSLRFYDNTLTQNFQLEYRNRIEQPFIISTSGQVQSKYTQSQRINHFHQFIQLKRIQIPNEDDDTKIYYLNGYLTYSTSNPLPPKAISYLYIKPVI